MPPVLTDLPLRAVDYFFLTLPGGACAQPCAHKRPPWAGANTPLSSMLRQGRGSDAGQALGLEMDTRTKRLY